MGTNLPETMGIWRLGPTLHRGSDYTVVRTQPVDATHSPRWDYASKLGDSDQARDGLTRSLAVGATVSHPNLVTILDGDVGGPVGYVVMPLLDGQTMQWHLTSGPRKPLPVALWLVRQICLALGALHAAGWTHGDVKPENVMVGSNGHVTLIDLAFAHQGTLMASAPFRGTPDYAAPELLVNASASSPASDIYAAGRILWQWLTRVDTANETLLSPVCELVERMVDDAPQNRPAPDDIVQTLLRLEIDSLGEHIVPTPRRRAA